MRAAIFSFFAVSAVFFVCCILGHAADPAHGEYEIGGPAAGLKLPVSPQNTGPGPEVELFPGSVEHWRGYMMKYAPMRSFFDKQSMLKRWIAAEQPGVEKSQIEDYASPIYIQPKNGEAKATGEKRAAVKVVRCEPSKPVFSLDLGELEPGMYAVRVIGAVPTDKLRRFRLPVFLKMKINDGPSGEETNYRISAGYVDEFYNVATFYFHALSKREYKAEVAVDTGSQTALLVHDISLDDVLAGTVRRAIKTKGTLGEDPPKNEEDAAEEPAAPGKLSAGELAKLNALPKFTPEERLARDEALWNWLPALNTPAAWVGAKWAPAELGVADKTLEQITAEHGAWESAGGREAMNLTPQGFSRDPKLQNAFIENSKLGLEYTLDDLRARKPLPDPFPYKDEGGGLFFPDPSDPAKGRIFCPIATEVQRRYRSAGGSPQGWIDLWKETGNDDFARDAAVFLARFAYQYPTLEQGNLLDSLTVIPQYQNRDYACRMRDGYAGWLPHYPNYMRLPEAYDQLFEYIKGNEELAKSIGRFVPWVKTSQDVVELFDVYLVQTMAKRILRYHYMSDMTAITDMATLLGDNSVTDPWMEWQFARTFVYPLRPAGLQDLVITAPDREGAKTTGSTYYSQGDGAGFMIAASRPYIRGGGNPAFDLSDPVKYPKPLNHAYWQLHTIIAGGDFARIGDVNGPDKPPGFTMRQELEHHARQGWEISGDPRFAWILAHVFQRKDETPEQWKKIQAAAATVKRAPWLDLPSRHVDNWFAALETGHEHDDPRFRRAAYLRLGNGMGHEHADALDLQIVAHGVPMTIDGGQRSGYSKPNDRYSRVHNTVEVNGGGEYGLFSYGWPRSLTDVAGTRYLRAATSELPKGAKFFERQIALVDVDEGKGSEPLPVDKQRAGSKLTPGVEPANSYVVDFFRVSGGDLHTYAFHGPINDDFQWNAKDVKPVEHVKPQGKSYATDAEYLAAFESSPESKAAGNSPEVFEATWRYLRADPAAPKGTLATGSENQMLGANFDPAAPRKFTRLSLFEAEDLRTLKADLVCSKSPILYSFTNALLQRRGEKLESVFTALIEPYSGEPFITAKRMLAIADNEKDARRAAAIEVETKNGHRDVIFSDGRPEKTRVIAATAGPLEAAAEFAFYSTDADGLRLATLTGGTRLQGPDVRLSLPEAEITAIITKVDYLKKTFWTDRPFPAQAAGGIVEILPPGRPTSFTIESVVPDGAGSRVTLTRRADFYRSPLTRVVADPPEVDGYLDMPATFPKAAGMTLSNDDATKTWRVKASKSNDFFLDSAVAEADFLPSKIVRLWEFGVGDKLRIATVASVRRTADKTFEVSANTPLTVSLRGKALELSPDGTAWKPAPSATAADGWATATLETAILAKPIQIRVP